MNRHISILTLAGTLLCLLTAPLAMAQTNEVLSSGFNANGQIGDNSTTNRLLLTPAFSISGIKAIAAGGGHTLALDSSCMVWAWGNNNSGQLGTGDTTDRHTPVPVLYGAKAIAAGATHSLALMADGTVYAWGLNANGQLGQGDNTDRHIPTLVSGVTRIKAIACGSEHSLMLDDSTHLYGCGWNYFGQLGLGDYSDRWLPTPLLNGSSGIMAIAAGFGHSLILWSYYGVFAAGSNNYGQLGDGTTTDRNYFVYSGISARSIAAGGAHSLAIGTDGTVMGWGYNGLGGLGTHDNTNRLTPTLMPGATDVKAVSAGGYYTLVLTASGQVLATGFNAYGQLGDGTTTSRNYLAPVANASMIGAISAGDYHSVLLKPFNRMLATGSNDSGQLGIGSTVRQKKVPAPMKIGGSIVAASIGPSGFHSLLLRADGTVWACGDNEHGQLGNGTTINSDYPIQVKGPNGIGTLSNIIAIAAGNFHSMALCADGTVYTWGANIHGQLGLGDTTDRYYPVQVPGFNGITVIAAGGAHSLILQALLNVAYACGFNSNGQLGTGDANDHSSFTYVNANYTTDLAGGNAHSLIRDDAVLGPFGANHYGQLGDGGTTDQASPEFETGTVAITMAGGGAHSLHLNGAGQVWASGYNGDGELGLGDTTDRYSWSYNPYVQATGIACGYLHSLFLDAYGNLYASGYGANGQLGNGSTASQSYPTLVAGAPYAISMAGGWGHTAILTAPRLQVASLHLSFSSVIGGSSVTGKVTLTGLAGAGGQTVSLSADSSDVSLPASVNVASTSKTASFTIHTSRVSANTVVHITATLNNQVAAQLTLTP